MKVNKKSYAKELFNDIYITEYEATLDEGWTIDNDSYEAMHFLELSDEHKKVYAMLHARQYAFEIMEMEEEEYNRYYDNVFED